MTDQMHDEQFDRMVRNFLAWQADDVSDAPTATEVATRISSRVGSRTFGFGLSPQIAWVLLAALLLVALLGTLIVGGILRTSLPAVVPTAPPSAIASSPVATSSPSPSAKPSPSPSPSRAPVTVSSGSAVTTIGNLAWTRVEGDATNLPAGDIFQTPDGFAAIETDLLGVTRFWESGDGLEWALTAMPVPATGDVGHAIVAGEHWIWSTNELRLWRSSDFAAWTEVDLTGLQPAEFEGVNWQFWPTRLATVGSTTVFPWYASGTLALSDLLDIELAPGELLSLAYTRDQPALGEPRDVMLARLHHRRDGRPGEKVGSIAVGVAGSQVTITDLERDVVVATVDAEMVGQSAEFVAADINRFGRVMALRGGAVIRDGTASAMAFPLPASPPLPERASRDGFAELVGVDGRFVGLTADPEGPESARLVWTSFDGRDWEPQGPPQMPVSAEATVSFEGVLRRADGDPDQPLIARVMISDPEGQRGELWTSADGVRWASIGLAAPYPGQYLVPFYAPAGGFLAIGQDDRRIYASPTGAEWSVADGLIEFGQTADSVGGSWAYALARDTAFIVETPNTRPRVLWLLSVGADE